MAGWVEMTGLFAEQVGIGVSQAVATSGGWAQYIPSVVNAVGTYQDGREQKRVGERNARALEDQARVARQQATRDEEMQRRESRMFRGRQAAALAEAGIGSEGSGGGLLDQSALFAEFDALTFATEGKWRRAA